VKPSQATEPWIAVDRRGSPWIAVDRRGSHWIALARRSESELFVVAQTGLFRLDCMYYEYQIEQRLAKSSICSLDWLGSFL